MNLRQSYFHNRYFPVRMLDGQTQVYPGSKWRHKARKQAESFTDEGDFVCIIHVKIKGGVEDGEVGSKARTERHADKARAKKE